MTRSITLNEKELIQIGELGTLPDSVRKKVQTSLKPRSSRYGKNKGAQFQKDCADFIAKLFGIEWDNMDDYSQIRTRSMGLSGNDLIMQEPLYSKFPYDIECKNTETLSIPSTVEQAKSNTKKGRHWLIMWKRKSFDEPVIVMGQSAFGELIKKGT